MNRASPIFESYRNRWEHQLHKYHKDPGNLPSLMLHHKKTEYCVLLVHGLKGSAAQLKEIGEIFYHCGMNVVSVLLSGHGTKPEDLFDVKLEEWKQDIDTGLRIATEHGKQVLYVGISAGGALGLDAALRYPFLLQGLILFSPSVEFRDPRVKLLPYIGWAMSQVRPWVETDADNIVENDPTCYQKLPVNAVVELSKLIKYIQNPAKLKKIRIPVFTVLTESDDSIDVVKTEKALHAISGNTHTMMIPKADGVTHAGVIHSKENARFTEMMSEVLSFLRENFSESIQEGQRAPAPETEASMH